MSATEQTAWVCTVCGYVHNGPEPPDECPVCGATRNLFEPYAEPARVPTERSLRWRCLNCEYVHEGPEPPDVCPVCGASRDRFEPYTEPDRAATAAGSPGKIVIAGAGIAGVSAAEAVRRSAPDAEIVLLSKEARLPYYRLNLTRYLAGEVGGEGQEIHSGQWYADRRIALRPETEISRIDLESKELLLGGGETEAFDRLILAMGSHPFVPPIPGANRGNVTVLRTRDDADFILERSRGGARCAVIGGGLLGLETAGALARRGAEVTLLEGFGWLLPRQLNPAAGRILQGHLSGTGIRIRTGIRVEELVGDELVRGVLLGAGETVDADLVIISAGVRPNSYLARIAGLKVATGVVVDDYLSSSHPEVLAAGDVAEHRGVLYGTWGPAQFQGTIAGMNAAGIRTEFGGIPRSNMLKVLDYDMFSIGQIQTEDASYDVVEESIDDDYFYFVFRDARLTGAIMMGDTSLSAAVKTFVERRLDCSPVLRTRPGARQVLEYIAGN